MWVAVGLLVVTCVLLAALLERATLAARRTRNALASSVEQARSDATKSEAIVAGMPDGLLVIDSELRVVGWNRHFPEFAGVPEGLVHAGLDLSEILRAQAEGGEFGTVDVDTEVERRLALIRSRASTGTIERHRPNGKVMQLRRSPMSGGGFVTLYTDVTERREAEAQLRQAQKMEAIGHLAGGMAHDFNNLLMAIGGNLDLALQTIAKSDLAGTDRRVRIAQGGVERAANITGRLLSFARQQELAPQMTDVNKVVLDISELIRHSIGGSIDLETVLGGGVWEVSIDIHQLENALINLAINARDAMPGGGKLTVETANTALDAAYAAHNTEVTPGQYVLVAVSDSGTGMTRAQTERAFEPFFTTKGTGKGSGLGLAQVFGFIKQSDGHVKIYTELGSGTTLKLYLPRHVPVQRGPTFLETVPSEPDLPQARDKEAILVVEDDEDVLAYTTGALETLGYHVLAAKDAPAALMALDGHPEVKLLMTDVELPGPNGQELAAAVVARCPYMAVIYTTGYTANAVVHRQLLERTARSLTKPFSLQTLAAVVRESLDVERMSMPNGSP